MKQQLGSAVAGSYVAVCPGDARQARTVRRKRFDVAAQKAVLTGAEIRKRLHEAGAAAEDLTTLFGLPASQVHRLLEGRLDGRVPLSLEIALAYLERHAAQLRQSPLSREAQTNRKGYRLAGITGYEILQRLRAIAWSTRDFARFAGTTDRTVRDIVYGRKDGRITMVLERALEFAERHPLELQALPRVQTPKRASPARREALNHVLSQS